MTKTGSKRSYIHLLISLTLLFTLFFVLPGVFLYRLGRQILTLPTEHKHTISPQALKQFKQKELLMKKDSLVNEISFTQEELRAGYFDSYYEERKQSIQNFELKVQPSGITISATVYLFSIPTPWPLNIILEEWFPVINDHIALYSRIAVVSQVLVENKKPTLKPIRIHIGKKEIPSDLLFLGKNIIPDIFIQSLPEPVERFALKEGEVILYKLPAIEDIEPYHPMMERME